jgi:hypothetical protein
MGKESWSERDVVPRHGRIRYARDALAKSSTTVSYKSRHQGDMTQTRLSPCSLNSPAEKLFALVVVPNEARLIPVGPGVLEPPITPNAPP